MLKEDRPVIPESYRPLTVRAVHKRVESEKNGMDNLLHTYHNLANSARDSLLVRRQCSSIVNLTRAIMNKKKNSHRGETQRKRDTKSQMIFN